jgi:hypothetical protein
MNRPTLLVLASALSALAVAAAGCFGNDSAAPGSPVVGVGVTDDASPDATDNDATSDPDADVVDANAASPDAALDVGADASVDGALVVVASEAGADAQSGPELDAPADAPPIVEGGATPEAGGFTCDSGDGSPITCGGATPVCKIIEGGAFPGIHPPSCVALPSACQTAPSCACLQSALGATYMCSEIAGDFTITQQVP